MNTHPKIEAVAYDAFGDRAEPERPGELAADSRRMRVAAVAVFWTIATLLTAGRVYHGNPTFASAAPAQVAALPTTIR